MNCPSCQAENPETARFCMHCGERLLSICPQCAADLPAGANFCPSCGAPITQSNRTLSSARARPVNLEKYIPPELAARLAAQAEDGLLGERRIVTMLFCDLKGSTAAAEQLDPEAWTEILNGAFEHMIQPVYEYEGTVARLMGDAILAFFGAPIAHEDDPQRAVLAALGIQERIRTYRLEVQAAHGIDIETRIGINTGLVVVGEIGSDLRMEYTAVGDAINLAARMEQTAQPGTIQIAAATQRLVEPFFELETLGEIEVKGKMQPVLAYRVLGMRQMSRQMPGQRRGIGARLAELVGRQAELAGLERAVWDLVPAGSPTAGRGAFFLIEGEAGLGKTTLVTEVQRKSTYAGTRWLFSTALAYRQSTSYFPWREIIRQNLGVPFGAQPPELREHLIRFAERHALPAETSAFLGALLGLEPAPHAELIAAYQGEELVLRLTHAVQETLERVAGETALVLVFDDLQWADEASLNLLAVVAELVTRLPLLLICLARPDLEAKQTSFVELIHGNVGQHFQRITLSPLNEAETTQLAAKLLAVPGLPEALAPLILSKADGNPLFVEELIRTLQESDQLVREGERWQLAQPLSEIALPDALNSLLSARIDRLPDKTRRVLQTASVFGSAFESQHLQALLGSENLETHLERLQQAGMIQSDEAQLVLFSFRHTLIQEAAYRSLLRKDRRRLHARIGELLEGFFKGRLEEVSPVLAQHFYAAGDRRSIQYDAQAGDAAARLYANREAA
ncbi:MAG: adenylate/guanylate cyclase domain-containing protein, partial [Anaerolineales bacterium]